MTLTLRNTAFTLAAMSCFTMALACGETPEDIIQEFVDETGLTYEDCGTGSDCTDVAVCLVDAFSACRPARAVLGDGTYFVVPDAETGGCDVIWFTESSEDGTFQKRKCQSIGNTSSSCTEKEPCALLTRWHL